MKNNSIDEILQKNVIAQMDTEGLLILLAMAIGSGLIFARIFKNQYDPRVLIKSYLFYGIGHCLIGIAIFRAPIIIVLGTYLLGAIFTIFRSNYYFYE